MSMVFGVPLAVLSGQLLIGIINGAFYALLSLGLAGISYVGRRCRKNA